jgi:hypothetical protein
VRENEIVGGSRIRMTTGLRKGLKRNIGGRRKEDIGMKVIIEREKEMIKEFHIVLS